MKRETQDKLWAVLTEEERKVFRRHYELQIRDARDRGFNDSVRFIFGEHNLNLASSNPNLASNVASSESNEGKVKEIDWEQRRYEVAKDIFTRLLSHEDGNVRAFSFKDLDGTAREAIYEADALINALKSETK
ncbi:MAG: hypothetical protein HDS62_09490 [Bacteroidales bacterium]|nr:hypothetical protein [Bacteroidales bacterium]